MVIFPVMISSDSETVFENMHTTTAKALAHKRRLYKNPDLQKIIKNSLPTFDAMGLLDVEWCKVVLCQAFSLCKIHLQSSHAAESSVCLPSTQSHSILFNKQLKLINHKHNVAHRYTMQVKIKGVLVELCSFFLRAQLAWKVVWGEFNDVFTIISYACHVIQTCFHSLLCCSFFFLLFCLLRHTRRNTFLPILGLVSIQPRPMNNWKVPSR